MENQKNNTQATAPVPGFTRKTVLRPRTESPAPEIKDEPTTEVDAPVMDAGDVILSTPEEPIIPDVETTASDTDMSIAETDEWESFMDNLRNYESRGCRENRTYCRLDNDIADALYELDINGKSRPDIVSAVMRGFLLRNKERLLQLRRTKKSFFETL